MPFIFESGTITIENDFRRPLNLSDQDLTKFADAKLNAYSIVYNKKKAVTHFKKEILKEYQNLNSEEVKKKRFSYFEIPNTKLDDYNEHLISLDDKNKVMAGIRHLGGNAKKPFVHVATNFRLNTREELLTLYDKIKSHFKMFNPLWVESSFKEQIDADLYGGVILATEQNTYAHLEEYKSENQLLLKDIKDLGFYDWYAGIYSEFHNSHPKLKDKVPVNSKEIVQKAIDENLIQMASYNGENIGVISAMRLEFLGAPSIYFNEILITKEYKGKGLAKVMQKLFVLKKAQEKDIIWGRIDFNNKASYYTALSNGRKPISFECFAKVV